MRLRGLAVHVNINVAVTGAGADVTKSAQTLQIVPAIHVGTAQNVFQSLPVPNIGENQMCFITAPAIILVMPGFATKEAGGVVPARRP